MVEPVYFEMIDPATPSERRATLEAALLTCCGRDTLAMVRMVEFFSGAGSMFSASSKTEDKSFED